MWFSKEPHNNQQEKVKHYSILFKLHGSHLFIFCFEKQLEMRVSQVAVRSDKTQLEPEEGEDQDDNDQGNGIEHPTGVVQITLSFELIKNLLNRKDSLMFEVLYETAYSYGNQKRGRPMPFKALYYVTTNQT